MLKSVIHIILSSMLIFTILAPPVLSLLDIEVETIFLKNEKKEKEMKELEEKTVFFDGFSALLASINDSDNNLFSFYQEGLSDYTSTILLPPPEYRV